MVSFADMLYTLGMNKIFIDAPGVVCICSHGFMDHTSKGKVADVAESNWIAHSCEAKSLQIREHRDGSGDFTVHVKCKCETFQINPFIMVAHD